MYNNKFYRNACDIFKLLLNANILIKMNLKLLSKIYKNLLRKNYRIKGYPLEFLFFSIKYLIYKKIKKRI